MKTKKLTFSALLIAICVVAGNVIYIPVGASKCFPVQHIVNVVAAVTLGPAYGVAIAFCVSVIRNLLGTGTLLAFPGSMIGVFLAGMIFKYTKKKYLTVIGEIFGTGILGGIVAYPIAVYVMGKSAAIFTYVVPFLVSTTGGSILAFIILKTLEASKVFDFTADR